MFKYLNPKLDFFGLDISDTSLKLAKIKKEKEGFSLSAYGKKELTPGIIEKGKVKDEDLLASEIRKLAKRKKLENDYVATSLPEEKSFFQIIQIPKVKRSRLKKMIEYEAEDYIPLAVEDIYLDYEIISEKRDKMDILVTALPKKVVDPHVFAIKKAGLFPVVAEVESVSIVRALVKEKEEASPLLLIDIGETKTILIILSKNIIIFTSYILTSSLDFTEKIAEDNSIPLREAEKIKVEHGINSDERPDIRKTLEPLLEETAKTIKKHLAYYNSSHGFAIQGDNTEEIEKIILSGGGANLKGLVEFLADKLNVSVEKGDPFVNLTEESKNFFQGNSLSYGTAFGLALRNFDQGNTF